MRLRVSFIDYLNSVPLGWSFLHGGLQDRFEILHDVPSECARHLASGEADVGLIPVVEYHNIEGLRILPGISIASTQEVRSVLFVSKVPFGEVRKVAVDLASRTSVVLLKVLLERFYECAGVRYRTSPAVPEQMLEENDAALIIGNPALREFEDSLVVCDLAQEWYRFTGLPFVFAFWGVRAGVDLEGQEDLFYQSREEGLRRIPTIASIYSERLGLTADEIEVYLSRQLDYSLGKANLEGLGTFFRLARELNLIESVRPLEYYSSVGVPD